MGSLQIKRWMSNGDEINLWTKDNKKLDCIIIENRKYENDECFLLENLDYNGEFYLLEVYDNKIISCYYEEYDDLIDIMDEEYPKKKYKIKI